MMSLGGAGSVVLGVRFSRVSANRTGGCAVGEGQGPECDRDGVCVSTACLRVSGLHPPFHLRWVPSADTGASPTSHTHPPNARLRGPAGMSSLPPNFPLGWLLFVIHLSSPGRELPSPANATNLLSMKIINKYIIKIEEFYLSQTEDYSPEDSLPDYSEKFLQRSMVFSKVLYTVRTKNIK